MPVYRNQTNTMTQIVNLSHIRITTTQEAVAFLRAIQPLNEQVASVLQRSALKAQQAINKQVAPAPQKVETPAPTPVVEPDKPFEPEDLSAEEGYSDKEVEEKVAKLKKAKSESKSKKESN